MSHPRQANGYRFGGGRFETDAPILEKLGLTVPGTSFADTGFELLAGDGAFVAWFECILDAVDALKVHVGPGKVVRCCDRALLKIRRR